MVANYEGIFWDIDGTLYELNRGYPIDDETEKNLLRGRIALENLPSEQKSYYTPREGLVELMGQLPRKNQGIISNGGQKYQTSKLNVMGLYNLVNPDLVFISLGEVEKILKDKNHPLFKETIGLSEKERSNAIKRKVGKPNPYMFERAIEASGLNPRDCVMIGDDEKDIEGAYMANMTGIYLPDLEINNEPLKALREILL